MDNIDYKFESGKAGVAVGGAAGAQLAEAAGKVNLADVVAVLTIIYVSYQIYAMFYDRNIKPRGGWGKVFRK